MDSKTLYAKLARLLEHSRALNSQRDVYIGRVNEVRDMITLYFGDAPLLTALRDNLAKSVTKYNSVLGRPDEWHAYQKMHHAMLASIILTISELDNVSKDGSLDHTAIREKMRYVYSLYCDLAYSALNVVDDAEDIITRAEFLDNLRNARVIRNQWTGCLFMVLLVCAFIIACVWEEHAA